MPSSCCSRRRLWTSGTARARSLSTPYSAWPRSSRCVLLRCCELVLEFMLTMCVCVCFDICSFHNYVCISLLQTYACVSDSQPSSSWTRLTRSCAADHRRTTNLARKSRHSSCRCGTGNEIHSCRICLPHVLFLSPLAFLYHTSISISLLALLHHMLMVCCSCSCTFAALRKKIILTLIIFYINTPLPDSHRMAPGRL